MFWLFGGARKKYFSLKTKQQDIAYLELNPKYFEEAENNLDNAKKFVQTKYSSKISLDALSSMEEAYGRYNVKKDKIITLEKPVETKKVDSTKNQKSDTTTTKPNTDPLNLQLIVSGSYENILKFWTYLNNWEYISEITKISLKDNNIPNAQTSSQITAIIDIIIYLK
jgi:hypothetical protein